MGKMRAMQHNSRANSSGRVHGTKHNDRDFDTDLADNIDQEKSAENVYWHLYQQESPEMTFTEAELKFYVQTFGEQLQRTNDNYLRQSHPERCKDMETWKMARQNAPEETVLQIGKMEGHADAATLMKCFQEYNRRLEQWNQDHGKPFTQLSYALHVDEAVPHIQTRRVWHYQDAQGLTKIGQEKALAKAGVELPDPGKKESRKNNRKVSFDKMTRELWLEVLTEHGLDIEKIPVPDGKHNREKEDMIRDKYRDMMEATDQAKADLAQAKSELSQTEEKRDQAQAELDRAFESRVQVSKNTQSVMAAKKKAEQDLGEIQAQIAPLKIDLLELEAREKKLKANVEKLEEQVQGLEEIKANLSNDIEELGREIDEKNNLPEKLAAVTKERNEILAMLKRTHVNLQKLNESHKDLTKENASLRKQTDQKVEEAVKPLKEQIAALTNKIDTLKGLLRTAFEVLRDVVKAAGIFKYGKKDGDFRLELTEKQGKLIDSIADHAAEKAREQGFEDLAVDMEQNVGICDALWDRIDPPQQQKKKSEWELGG